MGGIFSSPKAPAQSPGIEAGITRRETEAADAEQREKIKASKRRRRMMGGPGIGTVSLQPEELSNPLAPPTQTSLGVKRNPGT